VLAVRFLVPKAQISEYTICILRLWIGVDQLAQYNHSDIGRLWAAFDRIAATSPLQADRLPSLHNCHPTSILKCRNELEVPVPLPVVWQNADCVVFQRDDLVWLHERQSLFKLATHPSCFRGNESACVGDFEDPSMSPWS